MQLGHVLSLMITLLHSLPANSSAPHRGLRILLAVVALVELAEALASVQNIFTEYHHEAALSSVKLALAPRVASAAAVLAVMGRTRLSICALAALVLLDWVARRLVHSRCMASSCHWTLVV